MRAPKGSTRHKEEAWLTWKTPWQWQSEPSLPETLVGLEAKAGVTESVAPGEHSTIGDRGLDASSCWSTLSMSIDGDLRLTTAKFKGGAASSPQQPIQAACFQ